MTLGQPRRILHADSGQFQVLRLLFRDRSWYRQFSDFAAAFLTFPSRRSLTQSLLLWCAVADLTT